MSRRALDEAHRDAKTPYEREHVTPYLWQNVRGALRIGDALVAEGGYRRDYRLALDYPEDLALLEKLYERLYLRGSPDADARLIPVLTVLAHLDAHPELGELNLRREPVPDAGERHAPASVTVIDCGMGNQGSVLNALRFLGVPASLSRDENALASATHLILPGVGAFQDGMERLRRFGLIPPLQREVFEKKKPFLGICLGMQLLASVGEEGGEERGLGWIPGRVRRFRVDEKKFRVPHIGWNDVAPKEGSPLFAGIASRVFYFVHSYIFLPTERAAVEAACDYGENFPAAVRNGNIFGAQFHPEKSQKSGLALLSNFLQYA